METTRRLISHNRLDLHIEFFTMRLTGRLNWRAKSAQAHVTALVIYMGHIKLVYFFMIKWCACPNGGDL